MVESTQFDSICAVSSDLPGSTDEHDDKIQLDQGQDTETAGELSTHSSAANTLPPLAPPQDLKISVSEGLPSFKPSHERSCACCDQLFALVFLASVGATLAFAGTWGWTTVLDAGALTNQYLSPGEERQILGTASILAVCAFALAMLLTKLLTTWPRAVAMLALWLSVAGVVTVTAASFNAGQVAIGLCGCAFASFCLVNAKTITQRIPFVVANLRVATAALAKHQEMYWLALLFTAVQVIWIVLCALAFLGVASQLKTAREQNYRNVLSALKQSGAECSDSSECASHLCLPPMNVITKVCGDPTLKHSGEQCSFDAECVSNLCVTLFSKPRCWGPTAGTPGSKASG